MLKSLAVIPEKCTGCHRCELWCSFVKEQVNNPSKARIHVLRREPSQDTPLVCLHCGVCINACAYDAISRNKKTGAVVIDHEKCVACGKCLMACPYGMITMDRKIHKANKCDLCGGKPACVEHCKEGALVFAEIDKLAEMRREEYARALKREYKGGDASNLHID